MKAFPASSEESARNTFIAECRRNLRPGNAVRKKRVLPSVFVESLLPAGFGSVGAFQAESGLPCLSSRCLLPGLSRRVDLKTIAVHFTLNCFQQDFGASLRKVASAALTDLLVVKQFSLLIDDRRGRFWIRMFSPLQFEGNEPSTNGVSLDASLAAGRCSTFVQRKNYSERPSSELYHSSYI
jgi:hypothetical protein